MHAQSRHRRRTYSAMHSHQQVPVRCIAQRTVHGGLRDYYRTTTPSLSTQAFMPAHMVLLDTSDQVVQLRMVAHPQRSRQRGTQPAKASRQQMPQRPMSNHDLESHLVTQAMMPAWYYSIPGARVAGNLLFSDIPT